MSTVAGPGQLFNFLSLKNFPFGSVVPGGSRARYTGVSAPTGE